MSEKDQTVQADQTGHTLFETFVEQVKQLLDHLYDFAYLQQHPLSRYYDKAGDLSAKTAGRQLRYDLITAIESLKSTLDANFRSPDARLYYLLHLMYIENLTIQEAGIELGISERQAYRDLKRGQEAVASILWTNRLPASTQSDEISLQSEMNQLKVKFSAIDINSVFLQALKAVDRLAIQQAVEIVAEFPLDRLSLLADAPLAHQMLVSLLSYAVQQAQPGKLVSSFATKNDGLLLTIRYLAKQKSGGTSETRSILSGIARRLHWSISYQDTPSTEIKLHLVSYKASILVIDDNEGWMALLERFLAGFDCAVVTLNSAQEPIARILTMQPGAIILDVMMPETDGWEILQWLRTQPETVQIPVIVCSVFNDPQLAYSLGATAFVLKSTNLDKIVEALKELAII